MILIFRNLAKREILKKGGNAVDSAITTLLCMALVLPHSLGLGGGSFITYYDRYESLLNDFLVHKLLSSITFSN